MNYAQTLDYLYSSLRSFQDAGSDAYKPGLDRIEGFMTYLGRPHRHYATVHVAGTNGKGSTSHIIGAVLQAAGFRTGLFTSPHLHDFRERIRVDGVQISEREVVEFVDVHRSAMERIGLSFFEMTAAMAFEHFSREGVEVAVIETGLGGRLDATNIITPIASVITNIGLDHTDLLGSTVVEIAAEKAGIIKPEVPVIIGEHDATTDSVFERAAREVGANLYFAEDLFELVSGECNAEGSRFCVRRVGDEREYQLDLDLGGEYQRRNIITALGALEVLHRRTQVSISTRALIEGCRDAAATTGLQGRWQRLGERPTVVCDTGHNAHGLRYVSEQLKRLNCKQLYIVLGVVREKDLGAVLPLLPREAHYIFTQASVARALDAEELAHRASEFGLQGEIVRGVREAVAHAHTLATEDDAIFIGGSTFTVAEII